MKLTKLQRWVATIDKQLNMIFYFLMWGFTIFLGFIISWDKKMKVTATKPSDHFKVLMDDLIDNQSKNTEAVDS